MMSRESSISDDYLWDPAAQPDPEIVALERTLAVLDEPASTSRRDERVYIRAEPTVPQERRSISLEAALALAVCIALLFLFWHRDATREDLSVTEAVPETSPPRDRTAPHDALRVPPLDALDGPRDRPLDEAPSRATEPGRTAAPFHEGTGAPRPSPVKDPFADTAPVRPKRGRVEDPFRDTKPAGPDPQSVPPKDPFRGSKAVDHVPRSAPPKDPFRGSKAIDHAPKSAPPKDPFARP